MIKKTGRSLAILLCLCLVASATFYSSSYTEDSSTATYVTYGYSSTMSSTSNLTSTEDSTSTDTEPYQSLQWALYNDGTFSLTDSSWSDLYDFTDGGIYDGGGFTLPDQADGTAPDASDDTGYNNDYGYTGPGYGYNFTFGPGGSSFTIHFGYNGTGTSVDWNDYSSYFNNLNSLINQYLGQNSGSTYHGYSGRRSTPIQMQFSNAVTAVEDVDTDAVEAWDYFPDGGDEVIVAIIDTGVDYTHEDLSDVIWTNEAEIAGDGIDNDGNGYIDDVYGWNFYSNSATVYQSRNSSEYEHGTHVAGIIAAEVNDLGIAGLASNANVKIMIVKALGGSDGSGNTDDIVEAIAYAESMGATICNLSFGTTENDPALASAIENSDMLFVCAAGNGDSRGIGYDTDQSALYPASYDFDNVISVANLSYDGTLDSSSNYGAESVDIAAPGIDILSTTPKSTYEYLSGTSMAAPMVSAVAAMLASYDSTLSLSEIKEIIINSAVVTDELTGKTVSNGMLNAYNALVLADE